MRRSYVISIGLALGILVLGLRPASAQINLDYSAAFDPEQFAASADPDQIGLLDGARTQTKGSLGVGLAFHYAGPALSICLRDLASNNPACQIEGDILNSRFRADLGVLYGFGRFDVRMSLPLVLHQSTDFQPSTGAAALSSAGIGNPKLGLRYQIARPGPMNLAADLGIAIPTGGHNFIGDQGMVVEPRLLADVRAGRIDVGVDLGYRFRQKSAAVADLYVDDELTWSVAGAYWLLPHRLALGAAVYGRLGVIDAPTDPMMVSAAASEIGSQERPAEALGSIRYFVSPRIAVDVGAGAGLNGGYGAAPFRVLAGLRWINQKAEAPRPLLVDRDHDGIDDDDDKCPTTAEDVDGYQDTDGCPEADNDGDGIDDGADRCPLAAEDVDGYQDGDGCPDGDKPVTDTDGDGFDDGADKCPDAAEDVDGLQDDDGCPEDDADGDGLEDATDQCPTEAEVFNGTDDDDGCPDAGRTLAFVEGDAVVITEKIFFDVNRARIKTRSEPVLNAVASILKAHADLQVRVEGHTDDQGELDWNRTLSQLRSERVRDYLIKRGIAADRLQAQGFGYDQPLVRGTSEAARDKNRRVQFVIIGRTGAEPEPTPTTPTTPTP